MERIMTIQTAKEQAPRWAIVLIDIAAHGAQPAGIVGIYLDRHTVGKQGFVGNHALQLGKGPLGMSSVCFSLLLADLLALFLLNCAISPSNHKGRYNGKEPLDARLV